MPMVYNSTEPVDTDHITLIMQNNFAAMVGDPQIVGLRGQSFQVHGVDGAVYNIITEKETQVNTRFSFLTKGSCPILNGVPDTNCWSHPGSYISEMSFQQVIDGKVHAALITSGSAQKGFASITLDGKRLTVGDSVTMGAFSLNYTNSHAVSLSTNNFAFELSNSDMFINQAVKARVPLSHLNSHGLLGQTRSTKVYAGAHRYIEGEVDDYAIGDNDIFGSDFVYNLFQQ